MKLTDLEIEEFIKYLDDKYQDYCVNPDNMNFNCCDCYLCHVDFFNKIREELKCYEEGE